jgi:glycosyltransferase involved in cell wall biosynthesis
LILDGGSTDNSVEIIKKYENNITYWVSEKDKGQSDAINKGFSKATGEIITWLNSDDLFLPDTLNKVAEYFSNNPDKGAVSGDLIVIDQKGNELLQKKMIDLFPMEMIFSSISVPQPSTFFKRSALEKTGFLDTSLNYNMDLDFFIRMKKNGIQFGRINKPLTKFRLHNSSKTVSEYSDKVEKANYKIKKKHLNISFRMEERSTILKIIRFFFRFEIYLRKLFVRGSLFPYLHTDSVKSISGK